MLCKLSYSHENSTILWTRVRFVQKVLHQIGQLLDVDVANSNRGCLAFYCAKSLAV